MEPGSGPGNPHANIHLLQEVQAWPTGKLPHFKDCFSVLCALWVFLFLLWLGV